MPVTLVELEGDDEVLAEGDALRLIAALGEADGDPLPDKLAAALAVTLTLNDSEGDGDEEGVSDASDEPDDEAEGFAEKDGESDGDPETLADAELERDATLLKLADAEALPETDARAEKELLLLGDGDEECETYGDGE